MKRNIYTNPSIEILEIMTEQTIAASQLSNELSIGNWNGYDSTEDDFNW